MAYTQPPLDPAKTQPSATIGVPVKSPDPPAPLDENVHAGARVGTSASEIATSRSWLRVLEGSWPMLGHSPPVTPTGAHPETGEGVGPAACVATRSAGVAMAA